jgi:signal transduction histidine kinase/FixJ family two-component response regulator
LLISEPQKDKRSLESPNHQEMDYLLRFKSRKTERAFARGIEIYLKKTFNYISALLFVALTIQLVFRLLRNKGNLIQGFFAWLPIILIEILAFIFVVYCRRKSAKCVAYYRCITSLFDGFVLVGAVLFTVSFLISEAGSLGTSQSDYLFGYYSGSFAWIISFIASGWIPKSITLLAVNGIIVVSFYLKTQQPETLVSGIVIIVLGILFNYVSEKFERINFLEKNKITQQANCLREVINDILEGIVIYSYKKKQIVYSNPTVASLTFFDPDKEFESNFFPLTIDREISHQILNRSLGISTNTQADQLQFTNFMEFFGSLKETSEKGDANSSDSQTKSRYLINARHILRPTDVKKYEIQLLSMMYDMEPVWVFIMKDTTEHDSLITLQDNSNYKTRLLASVSHELRTPLNCAITFTKQAIQQPNLPVNIRETCLKPVLSSCKILLHVINDILDFSQIQQNALKFVFQDRGIMDTIKESTDLLSIQAKMKGIGLFIETKILSSSTRVRSDHNRVRQILLNLLSNALKFTFKGKITVIVQEKIVETLERKRQRSFEISVTDTGIGIKQEDQNRLFKAFEKIDLGDDVGINATGVGLGLVISNTLARSLGPVTREKPIYFESEYGSGSTFIFEILDQKIVDIERFDTEAMMIVGNEEESAAGSFFHDLDEGGRAASTIGIDKSPFGTCEMEVISCKCPPILIVDDDIFNIYALQSILKQFAVSAVTAYNGEEAIEACKARRKNTCCPECSFYRIILMDCNMPIMDGYQASKELKQMMKDTVLPDCPIIACTAFAKEIEVANHKFLNMDDYVTKPLVPAILMEKLKKYNVTHQKNRQSL